MIIFSTSSYIHDGEIPHTFINVFGYLANRFTNHTSEELRGALSYAAPRPVCLSPTPRPSPVLLYVTGLTPSHCVSLDPRTAGFLLHLTKERQEMGGWEEERGQPQVALPVAPDPTGQARQDSSSLPRAPNHSCRLLLSSC